MKGYRWLVPASLAVLAAAGCTSGPSSRATLASSEPSLHVPGDSGSAPAVVATPTPHTVTIVDRHPLLSKPKEYYDTSGDNKAVKVAAATIVGIPVGIVGELKQIVVGRPPDGTN